MPLSPTQYDMKEDHCEHYLVKQPMNVGTVMAKLSRTLDMHAKEQESFKFKPFSAKILGYESLFVCLLGNLFSSGFNPSCIFVLYSLEGS